MFHYITLSLHLLHHPNRQIGNGIDRVYPIFKTRSLEWHFAFPLMNSFNKTEAAVFAHANFAFLRLFSP